jgi:hypothetical protein
MKRLGQGGVKSSGDRKYGIQHSVKYTETTPTRGYELAPVRQSDMVHVVIR